ncbi:hypothetical protein SAMN05421505_15519 [Sinosporangium album]|uniref:Uncharacterized protein n=1 Tax=Sinosporangium album TaxID=504805 RepID=A0A1G8KUR9_9ACTN|nr:hypothetical protein SAMN05421505_15519 [Sinosporangium album]
MISRMASAPGVATRSYGQARDAVQLQTRVPLELKERYHAAARARGLSLSLYLEELIKLDPLAPAAVKEASRLSA